MSMQKRKKREKNRMLRRVDELKFRCSVLVTLDPCEYNGSRYSSGIIGKVSLRSMLRSKQPISCVLAQMSPFEVWLWGAYDESFKC